MASLSNINGLFDVHSTGAILFSTSHGTTGQILKSNGNAAPTWVDASTVIGGPYLPLTGGTLTGPLAGTSLTLSGTLTGTSAVFTSDAGVTVYTVTTQAGAKITFSDEASSRSQKGFITYKHLDTASYGSGNAFIIDGDQATMTILADGKLMYKEGVYLKPATGTGAGTRKDNLWDAAYNDKITALAVAGTTTKTLTATQQDGGTLTASWTDNDSGGTVTGTGANTQIAFWTGTSVIDGSSDLIWDNTNKELGIGRNPDYPLDVYRSSGTSGTSTGTTMQRFWNYVGGDLSQQKTFIDFVFQDDNDNEYPQVRIGAEVGQNADANSTIKEGSGAFVVYTNNATGSTPGTNSLTERMRVDYAGHVGIGTTSPSVPLEVAGRTIIGTGTLSTQTDALLTLNAPNAFAGLDIISQRTSGNIGGLRFIDSSNTFVGYYLVTTVGDHNWYTTNSSIKMTLKANGNLGIGDTNPSKRLNVYHPTSNVVAEFESGDSAVWIDLRDDSSSTYGVLLGAQGTDFIIAPNNNEAVRVLETGNVGINESNPSVKLETYEADNLYTPQIKVRTSTTNVENHLGLSVNNIEFFRQTTTGVNFEITTKVTHNSSGGNILFRPQSTSSSQDYTGVEQMRLTKAGLLGIGTGATVGADIHIKRSGDASVIIEADSDNVGENDNPTLFLRQDGGAITSRYGINGDANHQFTGAIGNAGYIHTAGAFQICAGNHSATFSDGAMIIDGGTATPSYKLDIRNAASSGINISGTGAYLRWNAGDMQIRNGGGYKMSFDTWNGSSLTEKMSISGGGVVRVNVREDIGTQTWAGYGSNPIAKLNIEVAGGNALNIFNTDENAAYLRFIDSQSNGSQYAFFSFSSGAGNPFIINNMGANAFYIAGDGYGGVGMGGSPSTGVAGDRLKITGDNNGLGCIKAISGQYSYGVRIEGSNLSTQLALYTSSTSQTTQINFEVAGNSSAGKITTTTNTTTYTTSSDYRLKENIIPISDSISRINQLKPSRFNFIQEPNKIVDGFIAHEVQEIVPEAIVGEKDEVDKDGNPVHQGIDQAKLVPLLVAAIQELEARVKELENK